MARLKASWELKTEIENLDISEELKVEIEKYIANEDSESTGKPYSYCNILYRSNLHYIIDNYDKLSLVKELKTLNDKEE